MWDIREKRVLFSILFAIVVLVFLYQTQICDDSNPTQEPIFNPTVGTTVSPTVGPTVGPTLGPTLGPTVGPTSGPTLNPTVGPTVGPTVNVGQKVNLGGPLVKSKKCECPEDTQLTKVSRIHRLIAKREDDERRLQKKYNLGWGEYKYQPVPTEYPLNGLGVDYDRQQFSTLPKNCNLMIVEPDLDFPYANLLTRSK